uniref:Uncharacterized protein n=1 Tax=Podoviridae sp. cttxo15 TaxID=2826584 RepID=A0A8S5N1C0_9CAUD|nr:MAG TPA: hypothetical protein [Podoviridae sp. cttxo15]
MICFSTRYSFISRIWRSSSCISSYSFRNSILTIHDTLNTPKTSSCKISYRHSA